MKETKIIREILVTQYPDVVKEIIKFAWKKLQPAWSLKFKVNQDAVDELTKKCLRALGRK